MKEELDSILLLEDKEDFQSALEAYRKIYSVNPEDFDLWKHYYFFLWYLNVEDAPLRIEAFVQENKLDSELKEVANYGLEKWGNNPEGLFILGYTINLFPYYFGEYEEWEEKGIQMLNSAANLDPENNIYKIASLALETDWESNEEYKKACKDGAQIIKETLKGEGLMNSYFREVLYRVND